MARLSVSRVLSEPESPVLVIYLVPPLPAGSSGFITVALAGNQPQNGESNLLAAGRVYLMMASPPPVVGSCPTRFTLTPHLKRFNQMIGCFY